MIYLIRVNIKKYTKNSYNSTSKNINLIFKSAEDLNRQFFQRRHTDGQQTQKKMLNITNHQGNAKQNHNEIPLHTSQSG